MIILILFFFCQGGCCPRGAFVRELMTGGFCPRPVWNMYQIVIHDKKLHYVSSLDDISFRRSSMHLFYFVQKKKRSLKLISSNWLNFLFIDNIFVMFGWRVFQQTVGIPMVTNCAPLLADLFLYSSEADFMQAHEKKVALSFNRLCPFIKKSLKIPKW